MKQLTCEMCGSTDLLKQDGVFVCQTCGCKYSVEEARKMMIEGTVQVDSSHLIENYLEMARNALKTSNYVETEHYCNKVLEVDPNNYMAWEMKGQAAGWQSTLENLRFTEAVNSFIKAYEFSPNAEKNAVEKDISTQIQDLSQALIKLRCDRFQKWPDGEEAAGFITDLTSILAMKLQFATNTGIVIKGYEEAMSIQIYSAVSLAYKNKIRPEYNGDEGHPSDYDLKRYLERTDNCIKVLVLIVKLNGLSESLILNVNKTLVTLHNDCIDSCSYKLYGDHYLKSKFLSESAKAYRRAEIAKYQAVVDHIENRRKREAEEKRRKEESERAKRIAENSARKRAAYNAFWENHESERKALEAEVEELNQKKFELKKNNTGHQQIQDIDKRKASITHILQADRLWNSFLTSELQVINSKTDFWQGLKETEAYDAYLDKYPILKQEQEARKQISILKGALQTKQKQKPPQIDSSRWAVFGMFLFGGVSCLAVPGDDLLALFLITIGIIFLTIALAAIGPGLYEKAKYIAEIRTTKYEIAKYQKILDKIAEIPRYSGHAENAAEFLENDCAQGKNRTAKNE